MRISVVGLGKLGSPIVAVLAAHGFEVIGIDRDESVVAKLHAGIAPVEEPHLEKLLHEHAARVQATTDWGEAIGRTDATFIIVPTPSGADGSFKNDHVLSAIDEIGHVLKRKSGYHLVVVNSTTMPGSVGGPIRSRLEAVSGKRVGPDIGLCYNPEFIALGDVVNGLLHPDFVLIGESDDRAGSLLEGIYRRIHGDSGSIARMNLVNAELTKISVNTYVTTKISFANMLSEICDKFADADVDVVTDAIGRDTRIGSKYLRAATAYGGPCFPRDTVAFSVMARSAGVEASLADATDRVNMRQGQRLLKVIESHTQRGASVAILGLAYKPGTPVIEASQGISLAIGLADAGFRVRVHDPLAMPAARVVLGSSVTFAEDVESAVAEADAVVLLVPWPQYATLSLDWFAQAKVKLLVDCWRTVPYSSVERRPKVIYLGKPSTLQGAENPVHIAKVAKEN